MKTKLLILTAILAMSVSFAETFTFDFTNSVTAGSAVLWGDGVSFYSEDASVTGFSIKAIGVDNSNNQTSNTLNYTNRKGNYALSYDGGAALVEDETTVTIVGTADNTTVIPIGTVLNNKREEIKGIRIRCDTFNTNGYSEAYDSVRLEITTLK